MKLKEELILAITKEVVAQGKGLDSAKGSPIPRDAAKAILSLANAVMGELESEKEEK